MPDTSTPSQINTSNWQLQPPAHATWGPRSLPDTELIYVHAGSLKLKIEDTTQHAHAKQLLLIPAGVSHHLRIASTASMISCIHCDLPDAAVHAQATLRTIHDPEIPNAFQRCADAFLQPTPWRMQLMQSIVAELWIRIQAEGSPQGTPLHVDSRITEIVQYIQAHYSEPLNREQLAAHFHMTPQHLNHLFRKELQTTPTEVLHRERLKRAFLMIQNEHISIKEAAERTGFYDSYHFSKVFKKAYSFPPSHINRFFLDA